MTAGMADPEVGYRKDWWPTLNALEPIEVKRASIAVEQFLRDPMDTFPIVRRKDEAKNGEYRTKRLILEAYDRLAVPAEAVV